MNKNVRKKLGIRYFTKNSVIVRSVLSAIFLTALILLIVFQNQISSAVYDWNKTSEIAKTGHQVHFIDVGQGDAALIEFEDGKNMLIDAGPASAGEKLTNYIKERDIEVIDYFLISHADADHVGGGVRIFQEFDVKEFYRPMTLSSSESPTQDPEKSYPSHPTITYDNVIQASVAEPNLATHYTQEGMTIAGENYLVKVLYPDIPYVDTNDNCAALQVTLDGYKFLFMGDADKTVENKLVEQYHMSLKCDVLKVGHHGAKSSTSQKFLEMALPDFAVISSGINSYGHPDPSVVNLLENFQVTTLQTTLQGDIVATVSGGSIKFVGSAGKKIDVALWSCVISICLLMCWGVPDIWRSWSKNNGGRKKLKK